MNPRALSPQDIDVPQRDVHGECILLVDRHEVLEFHERGELPCVAAPGDVSLDPDHMTAELDCEHSRRAAETAADVDNRAGRRDPGRECELEDRLHAAAVVLIGQLGFRIHR